MYIDKVKDKEGDWYKAGGKKFVPCTVEEVRELEHWRGHRLPEAYREFLLWMGHWGGGILQGEDCFYSNLKEIQEWAQELLEEDHFPGRLPEDAFVFYMHHGYQFAFFRLSEGDDPPIYYYLEEEPVRTSFSLVCPSFSNFLLKEVEQNIRAIGQMGTVWIVEAP